MQWELVDLHAAVIKELPRIYFRCQDENFNDVCSVCWRSEQPIVKKNQRRESELHRKCRLWVLGGNRKDKNAQFFGVVGGCNDLSLGLVDSTLIKNTWNRNWKNCVSLASRSYQDLYMSGNSCTETVFTRRKIGGWKRTKVLEMSFVAILRELYFTKLCVWKIK